MSLPESKASRRRDTAVPVRRVRHEVRDGLSVAAVSGVASVGGTVVIWALVRWLA